MLIRNLGLLVFMMMAGFMQTHGQSIIPNPIQNINPDKKFNLSEIKSLYVDDKSMQRNAEVFNEFLAKTADLSPLPILKAKQNAIILALNGKAEEGEYSIDFLYNNCLKISGKPSGVFYGLMSVLQCRVTSGSMITKLDDHPAFGWRGMHLDVSRHFFDKNFIKKYLDILALHKMNTFHWHLTDDQGWRIEIKQFPLLTSIGSYRKETMIGKNFTPYKGDGKPVDGFYSQEDIKEIVTYAADRHITVVPEIEMPGHALAALSAYPQYSCTKKKLEPMTSWGVSDDVFCPNDSTVAFVKKILDEVLSLFPSKYIHIGGDEVPKTRWKACPVCQETIRKNGLKDEHELQSFFIKKIDAYLTSKGRNMIGWDEILEGGIAPNAAIMSWRGEEGGIEASKQNHYVVMTPGSHCYFDHYQGNKQTEPLAIGGYTPIDKVFNYSPIPANLPASQQKYILGAQGNVWTEYIPNEQQVEYMALPRLCALAEVLWCGKNKPDYANFIDRLENHFTLLDKYHINYSRAVYDVKLNHQATGGYVFASAEIPFTKGTIRYTLDGEDPEVSSNMYTKRVFINKSSIFKAQYFENNEPKGVVASRVFEVHKAVTASVSSSIDPVKNSLALLTDAQIGKLPKIIDEFVCWKDQFPSLIVDLHRPTLISNINIYALKELESNNYLPTGITIEYSNDGKTFLPVKYVTTTEIDRSYSVNNYINSPISVKARYFKLSFENKNELLNPDEKAWLLISELVFN